MARIRKFDRAIETTNTPNPEPDNMLPLFDGWRAREFIEDRPTAMGCAPANYATFFRKNSEVRNDN